MFLKNLFGAKEKLELRKRQDELAMQYYGRPYEELCLLRQGSIDGRIREEESKKAS